MGACVVHLRQNAVDTKWMKSQQRWHQRWGPVDVTWDTEVAGTPSPKNSCDNNDNCKVCSTYQGAGAVKCFVYLGSCSPHDSVLTQLWLPVASHSTWSPLHRCSGFWTELFRKRRRGKGKGKGLLSFHFNSYIFVMSISASLWVFFKSIDSLYFLLLWNRAHFVRKCIKMDMYSFVSYIKWTLPAAQTPSACLFPLTNPPPCLHYSFRGINFLLFFIVLPPSMHS